MLKYEFSRKTKNTFRLIIIILLLAFAVFISGLATQLIMKLFLKQQITPSFNPITCFKYAFMFEYSKIAWIGEGFIAVLLFAYAFSMSDKRGKLDSKMQKDENLNFEYSGKENYGSAKQMTDNDIRNNFRVVPANKSGIEKTDGAVIFGFLNDKKHEIVSMPVSDYRKGTDYNRNIAVCGPPGSNKTRGFIMNYIIQRIRRGESCVVVDTKGEIYSKTYNYAKKNDYEIKILNLIELEHSDGWDILGEVKNNPEMATELAATIIRNTGGAKSDPFWNDAEMNVLKAVILLKSVGQADISNIMGTKQTMGDVYKYIATRKISIKEGGTESMEADFTFLREYIPNHPAITPFLQFQNAGDDVCKKILHGLANRLQLFQNEQLCKVLGTKDIDLEAAGNRKVIYYLRFSDQTSTYSFITALFFSFLFVKLVGYADSLPERKLPIPVNLVLDEFCNIGAIPDFEIKMATVRSRMINVVIVYQNNMLFETTYPDGLWEAILATCDTFVVLGVGNELTTAKYVSEMTGEATTSVGSSSMMVGEGQLRTTASTGKRYVKTPDEIRRLSKRKALVFLRACQVMEVVKMDYTENPEYFLNKELFDNEVSVSDHKTIVEKVDVHYEDYTIDSLTRDTYKGELQTKLNASKKSTEEKGTDKNISNKDIKDTSRKSNTNRNLNGQNTTKNKNVKTSHGGSHRPTGI